MLRADGNKRYEMKYKLYIYYNNHGNFEKCAIIIPNKINNIQIRNKFINTIQYI